VKELVEHIRAVHFTVFVIALVLTIAIRGHRKPQLDRAADDAEAILLLNQKWRTVTEKLTAVVNSSADLGFSSAANNARTLEVTPGRFSIKGHSVYARPLTFDVEQKWMYVDQTESDENPGWGESQEFIGRLPVAWKNLKEFLESWDGFRDGRRAFVQLGLATTNRPTDCGDIERVSTSTRGGYPSAFLVSRPILKGNWILAFGLEAMDEDPNKHKHACDFAPIEVSRWRGDLGAIFAEVTSQAAKWGNSAAEDAFRDLIAETKYLEDLPIQQLANALRQRANTDTDTVELFQAKIPVEAIATYGALVLIVCQLYLLAHLIELRRLAKDVALSDWPTGYIGLYQNGLFFVFTFLSMVLWPPVPLYLFTHGAVTDRSAQYFSWGAVIASLVLGAASARMLASVRNLRPR
jgi:hypothetical protein